ncbi:uncharacterized protein LOC142340963 isoform X2 [Convolutriloba macropyga]|uniref:uncharacterized protein LOC142340963 isoform X2 n=1 Tax=Convolutriloba macropyga TaxID=536237 RepID=UPI003F5224A4
MSSTITPYCRIIPSLLIPIIILAAVLSFNYNRLFNRRGMEIENGNGRSPLRRENFLTRSQVLNEKRARAPPMESERLETRDKNRFTNDAKIFLRDRRATNIILADDRANGSGGTNGSNSTSNSTSTGTNSALNLDPGPEAKPWQDGSQGLENVKHLVQCAKAISASPDAYGRSVQHGYYMEMYIYYKYRESLANQITSYNTLLLLIASLIWSLIIKLH